MDALLRLPAHLEAQFHQDHSVQRTFTLFDVIALTHVVLVNGRYMRLFKVVSAPVLVPAQRLSVLAYLVTALLQLAWIAAAPQHYRRHRYRAAVANRLLRLALMALSLLQTTPAMVEAQKRAYLDSEGGGSSSGGGGGGGGGGSGPLAGALEGLCPPGCQDMVRVVLVTPLVHLWSAYFVLSFPHVLLLQLATTALAFAFEAGRVCALQHVRPGSPVPAVPACLRASELAHAGAQLLGWDMPASPRQLAGASEALCADPLTALVLLRSWAQPLVLLALPLVVVYSVERSLKTTFMAKVGSLGSAAGAQGAGEHAGQQAPAAGRSAQGGAAPAAGLQQAQHSGSSGSIASSSGSSSSNDGRSGGSSSNDGRSSSGGRSKRWARARGSASKGAQEAQRRRQQDEQEEERQRQQQQAAAALDNLCGTLAAGVGHFFRAAMFCGAAVLTAVLCWHAAELGVVVAMRGGERQFVCDAAGWLTLAPARRA